MEAGHPIDRLCEALKAAVAALERPGVPFTLGGSVACWARGGPEPWNDLDLMVRPTDAERALQALADAGMRTERPPEQWLFKAWSNGVLIDVIFAPAGLEVTDDVLGRSDRIPVLAVDVPVMTVADVLTTKLCAMDEHAVDYARVVAIARSLREQIDWNRLRQQTAGSVFARTFFTLVEGLGIAPAAPEAAGLTEAHSRLRVLPD